jgi:hypothetical protein
MHRMLCERLTGYGEAPARHKACTFSNSHDQCIHRGDGVWSQLTI